MRYILLAFLLTACATGPDISVPAEIAPYVAQFQTEARNRQYPLKPYNIKIRFRKLKKQTVGLCHYWTLAGGRLIEIDPAYWNYIPKSGKENLIFHELGHCAIDRDHCKYDGERFQVVSIMEPNMFYRFEYEYHREKLVNELFKPNPRCHK